MSAAGDHSAVGIKRRFSELQAVSSVIKVAAPAPHPARPKQAHDGEREAEQEVVGGHGRSVPAFGPPAPLVTMARYVRGGGVLRWCAV